MNNIYEQWEQKRSELNHNWLSNNYLRQLSYLNTYLEALLKNDSLDNRKELLSIYNNIIPQWHDKRNIILDLLKKAEKELSPVNYFNYIPLSNASSSEVDWLKEVINNIWLSKYKVTELVEATKKILLEADYEYSKLINLFETVDFLVDKIPEDVNKVSSAFYNACKSLSYKLSEFPKLEKVL